MKNVRSKTHIADDRFVILLEENAQFIADELQHLERCVWCLERFSSFIWQNIQECQDRPPSKDSADELTLSRIA